MIYLWEPDKGSEQHPCLPLTLQTPLDLLDHLTLATEHQRPKPIAEPSLVLGPMENSCFESRSKRARETQPNEECI